MVNNILRISQVKQRTGLSRSSIYAKSASGEFPSPIKLGSRASGWVEQEVDDWIEERIVSSRKGKEAV